MKSASIKCVTVSSNGTIKFSATCLKSIKQVIFHEKDLTSLQFFIKPTKSQLFQNISHTSYKSKYKS